MICILQIDAKDTPAFGTPPRSGVEHAQGHGGLGRGIRTPVEPVCHLVRCARHDVRGPSLGGGRDNEADGQPSAGATGDGADEDGVTIADLSVGQVDASATVDVRASFTTARVDAWIDDGDTVFDAALDTPIGQLNFTGDRWELTGLATPTEEELRLALADNESGISNLALRYYRETGAGNLVTTMGKRGVVLFAPPEAGSDRLLTDYLPSLAHNPRGGQNSAIVAVGYWLVRR